MKELVSENCPFCNPCDMVFENDSAFAIYDKHPVSDGHILVIPKRHFEDYFECTTDENKAIFELILKCKVLIQEKYNPGGFNIGVNCGEVAGQTIGHAHIHVIPRYKEDVLDPRGGIRGIISDKRIYMNS